MSSKIIDKIALFNSKDISSILTAGNPDKKLLGSLSEFTQALKDEYDSGVDSSELPISDDDYDRVVALLEKNNIHITGSVDKRFENDTPHIYDDLKGTTLKAKYIFNRNVPENENIDVTNTLEKYLLDVYSKLDIPTTKDITIRWSLKLDGMSLITQENFTDGIISAITRGKDGLGTDMTHLFKNIRSMNESFKKFDTVGIKNEIMMTHYHLDKYNKETNSDYKNTRNAINSILSRGVDYVDKYLTLVPLDWSIADKELFATSINHLFNNTIDYYSREMKGNLRYLLYNLEAKLYRVMEVRDKLTFDIDGIVVEIMDKKYRELLGRKDDKNLYEIALKFPSEFKETILTDISYSVSKNGKLTPMGHFEEIVFSNNSHHTKATLSSYGKMTEMNLHYGEPVIVKYVGDVIPQIYKKDINFKNDTPVKPIIECPICGRKLELSETGKVQFCPNDRCKSRRVGLIENLFKQFKIRDISENRIAQLYESGILTSIKDFIHIEDKKSEILTLPSWSGILVSKLINSIHNTMKNPIKDYVLLAAMCNIEGVKKRMFEKILTHYTIDEFLNLASSDDYTKLADIDGVGMKIAKNIYSLFSNIKDVDMVKSYLHYFNYTNTKGVVKLEKVRMTNCRLSDDEINKLSDKFDISDSGVTKDTKILLTPTIDDINRNKIMNSSKVKKANKYGIEIISIDEFRAKYL